MGAVIVPCFVFATSAIVPCFWYGAVIVPACFDLLSPLSCDWCQETKPQKKQKEEAPEGKK